WRAARQRSLRLPRVRPASLHRPDRVRVLHGTSFSDQWSGLTYRRNSVRIQHSGLVIVVAAVLGWSAPARAEESTHVIGARAADAIARAWLADDMADGGPTVVTRLGTSVEQIVEQRGRAARTAAGPDIGMVGL